MFKKLLEAMRNLFHRETGDHVFVDATVTPGHIIVAEKDVASIYSKDLHVTLTIGKCGKDVLIDNHSGGIVHVDAAMLVVALRGLRIINEERVKDDGQEK